LFRILTSTLIGRSNIFFSQSEVEDALDGLESDGFVKTEWKDILLRKRGLSDDFILRRYLSLKEKYATLEEKNFLAPNHQQKNDKNLLDIQNLFFVRFIQDFYQV
jgi:hypothetical protein